MNFIPKQSFDRN